MNKLWAYRFLYNLSWLLILGGLVLAAISVISRLGLYIWIGIGSVALGIILNLLSQKYRSLEILLALGRSTSKWSKTKERQELINAASALLQKVRLLKSLGHTLDDYERGFTRDELPGLLFWIGRTLADDKNYIEACRIFYWLRYVYGGLWGIPASEDLRHIAHKHHISESQYENETPLEELLTNFVRQYASSTA